MGALAEWGTGIILSVIVLFAFTSIASEMNHLYNSDQNVELRDQTDINNSFMNYMDNSQERMGGEIDLSSGNGITLKSSYDMVREFINLVWNFLSGGWIGDVIQLMNLGSVGARLAFWLRILYFVSLIFGLIYLLFKVNP
jgi:hypothetical protein